MKKVALLILATTALGVNLNAESGDLIHDVNIVSEEGKNEAVKMNVPEDAKKQEQDEEKKKVCDKLPKGEDC